MVTVKHVYLVAIFFGTFVGKNKNRQNMIPRNTVSNSVTISKIDAHT